MRGEKAELLKAVPLEKSEDVFVRTLSKGQEAEAALEAARQCPVNAIEALDADSGEALVKSDVERASAKEVEASYDDATEFVLDPAGYFLIRVDRDKMILEAAFCGSKNEVELVVRGETPIEIYHTILVNEGLKIRPEHAAYLGRELEKAYLALKHGADYVQDDPLDISGEK